MRTNRSLVHHLPRDIQPLHLGLKSTCGPAKARGWADSKFPFHSYYWRKVVTKQGPVFRDAVFPTRNDTWLQVSNVQRRWREIRADAGLDWVTPHTFRKTVATLISEELDPEVAAQQLGHTSSDIIRRFYISKPALAANASDLLERLADPNAAPQISE